MGLLNTTATTAEFESEDDSAAGAKPADVKVAETTQPAAAATTTAVAEVPKTSVALKLNTTVLDTMKDNIRVEYNTLIQIIASNGNFLTREDKKVLGDTIIFDLISYQDSWVVTPGDDNAPDDLVRFSDDGVICSDGTLVTDHLALLRIDYPKAALKKRTVAVGAIQSASKSADLNNELVQFDLSPSSKVQFDRYRTNCAYKIKIGLMTEEKAVRIKATAELATNGANTYTLAKFTSAA